MIRFVSFSCLVLCSGLTFSLFAQDEELAKDWNLNLILEKSKYDSVLNLERMVALEFHKLLNEYRKSKGLKTLVWNDLFWLACRNHNIYMSYHRELSHSESKSNTYYSGESPGDRLNYVQSTNNLSWSGENALYNYSSNGSNTIGKASHIARSSFEQWKKSTGHNNNMLGRSHEMHGAAFKISGGMVYATSLFGYATSTYWADYHKSKKTATETKQKDEILTTTTLADQPKKDPAPARLHVASIRKKLENAFLKEIQQKADLPKIKQEKALKLCARKQVQFMAANNMVVKVQKRTQKAFYARDLAKRIAKAEGKILWFLTQKTDVSEYILMIETEERNYIEESVRDSLFEKLINDSQIDTNQIEDMGFSVKVKRKKSNLTIYACLLIRFH